MLIDLTFLFQRESQPSVQTVRCLVCCTLHAGKLNHNNNNDDVLHQCYEIRENGHDPPC